MGSVRRPFAVRALSGPLACGALWIGLTVALAQPSAAACSCTDKDPATTVELRITATASVDDSRIGPEQREQVVDLRGATSRLVGKRPLLLGSTELADVPVLMVATEDPKAGDGCASLRPAVGTDLSLTGHVYLEETGPVIWTGPCQGQLTVIQAPVVQDDSVPWLGISAAVMGGLAILLLALVPVQARRRARPPS